MPEIRKRSVSPKSSFAASTCFAQWISGEGKIVVFTAI